MLRDQYDIDWFLVHIYVYIYIWYTYIHIYIQYMYTYIILHPQFEVSPPGRNKKTCASSTPGSGPEEIWRISCRYPMLYQGKWSMG